MNWDQIEGKWKQLKGRVRERWGKLTDDELDTIEGKRERLAGKIQEKYGLVRDEAERQLKEFERSLDEARWVRDARPWRVIQATPFPDLALVVSASSGVWTMCVWTRRGLRGMSAAAQTSCDEIFADGVRPTSQSDIATYVRLRPAAHHGTSVAPPRGMEPSVNEVSRIGADAVKEMLDGGERVQFVDTRNPKAWGESHEKLPDAIRVPADEVEQHRHELPRDYAIITYCTWPHEASSARVAQKLIEWGWSRAQPLAGGFEAWKARGYPTEPK
jgi:uncharacterized protein YjbJ (UPF0337 family)/rhodanese-related sulfurtransferase